MIAARRSRSPRFAHGGGSLLIALAVLSGCGPATIVFAPDGGQWPAQSEPAWSHQARLAITDDGDDTLALVSATTAPALLGLAPVGDDPTRVEGPHHLAASPDGKTLYVNLSNYAPGSGSGPAGAVGLGDQNGKLLRVDAATYRQTGELTVQRDPGDVVLTADGQTGYVSHYDLDALMTQLEGGLPDAAGYSTVAVVDIPTLTASAFIPVCDTAHGLALSADEKTLYVACSLADQIAIVDLGTQAVERVSVGPLAGTPGQPNYFPYALARAPGDGRIWISCNGASGVDGWSGVRVFDPPSGKMDDADAVALPGIAMFGDFLPDGRTLVVPQQGTERVSFIDTQLAMEVAGIDLPDAACLRAHMVRVAAGGQSGWLTCEGDHVQRKGTLVALDLAAHAALSYVEVGLYSDGFTLLPALP